MKATGIVRKTDSLGRLVIPKEIRRVFGFDSSQELEVFTEGNTIIIKKFQKVCVICGGDAGLQKFSDTLMCGQCITAVSLYQREPEGSIAL